MKYLSVDEAVLALDGVVEAYQRARSLVRSGERDCASASMMDTFRRQEQRAFVQLRESLCNVDMARRGHPTLRSQVVAAMADDPAPTAVMEIGIGATDIDVAAADIHERAISGEWDVEALQVRENARVFTVAALAHIVRDIIRHPLRRMNGANREPGAFEAGLAAVQRHISISRKAA